MPGAEWPHSRWALCIASVTRPLPLVIRPRPYLLIGCPCGLVGSFTPWAPPGNSHVAGVPRGPGVTWIRRACFIGRIDLIKEFSRPIEEL